MKSFKLVYKYLSAYTPLIVFSVILMGVEVAANILQPKYMADIVDNGVLQMNMDVVVRSGILMLAAALIGGIGGYCSCVLSGIYSQRFGNDLRKALYRKIITLPTAKGDFCSTGSLITRMTNDTRVVTELTSSVIQMLVKPLMLFVFGIVMVLLIDPIFGLILLVSLPLQILLMVFFIKHSASIFSVIQKLVDGLNRTALHITSNSRLIKSYATEMDEGEKFKKQNVELTSTVYKVQMFLAILNPLIMLILNGVVILVIVIGGHQVQENALQIGSVMAAINYTQQILLSMMTIGSIFQYISKAKVSTQRLAEVFTIEPDTVCGHKKFAGKMNCLSFEHITFRHPGEETSDNPVLDDVSFDIRASQNVGILGTTGSGKSSVAKLIARCYYAESGVITIDNEDIKLFDVEELRQKIAVVFQDSDMFSGSIYSNITKGCKEFDESDFEKAVRAAEVDSFVKNLADGYDTEIADRGMTLSGGQRQRVAIARALLRKPELLIFDDSTSSLDSETEAAVFSNISELYPDLTKLIISQRVSSVINADKIVLLDNGKVDAIGNHLQLLDGSVLYRAIYETQALNGGDYGGKPDATRN